MTTSEKITQWLYEQINREVEKWFRAQCANVYADFYIYYKQGDICIAEDAPDTTYSLADPQRIYKAATMEQAKRSIYDVLYHCPCLPATL